MRTGNARHELGEGLQACAGFVLLVLVFTGMSGTLYKLLSPDGWIADAFGRSLSTGVAALLALFGIAFAIWINRGSQTTRLQQRAATAIVYLFAFAGMVYLVQYWMRGAF